jgi:ribosomal protein L11 methyltransferase
MTSSWPSHVEDVSARFETDEQTARILSDRLFELFGSDDVALSVTEAPGGRWRVTIYCRPTLSEEDVRAAVAAAAGDAHALIFERVAAKDWVHESLSGLEPVSAGRFIVHGAHDRARVAPNRIGIEIEAALAFGTGHHGTTRGCLLALERICKSHRRPLRIFDLGTGTGVLAIAAARALRQHVLATDIDASSIGIARDNTRINSAAPLITVLKADGVTTPAVRACAPFDLIFANILLGPLRRLASPLTQLIAPGGRLVLSGILSSQANAAIAAYHALTLERRIVLDGWTTLIFVSNAQRPTVARHRHDP